MKEAQRTKTRKEGQVCDSWPNVKLDFCSCNQPLCNTKFPLPENFEVDGSLEELTSPAGK